MSGVIKKLIHVFLIAIVAMGTFGVSLCIHSDGTPHLFSGIENSPATKAQVWGVDSSADTCVDFVSNFTPNTTVEKGKLNVAPKLFFIKTVSAEIPRPSFVRESFHNFKTAPPEVVMSGIWQNTSARLLI